jgi:hypothetical protein
MLIGAVPVFFAILSLKVCKLLNFVSIGVTAVGALANAVIAYPQ